jgi:4-aminobutyrate aminotransferase-like enzyme/Ser/Thr protein kinase RdoA (MazF antagonist)
MLSHAPRFDAQAAARLAHDLYGLSGTVRSLTSERDQNFLLETSGGERVVLKIANALEDPAMLDAQQRAMTHVGSTLDLTPRVIPTRQGSTLHAVDGHLIWAVSHRPGIPLGLIRHRSPVLLEALGAEIGALTRAFRGFDHPALHRDFYWDLARGRSLVALYRPLLAPDVGATVDVLMDRFDREAAPLLADLPRSAIHGDLNDFNVLVDGDRVTGFVDFGDMVYGYTVGDLAIAAAYAMLDSADPAAVVSQMTRGYLTQCPLSETERAAVFPLAVLRLCTSACVAAHQQRERPDNAYLGVSQAAIRRTLPRLNSARIVSWLATQSFAPVMDLPSREVLDLSVGGSSMDGVRVGIGRWDEPRLIYTAPFFEGRTIHLGIDLFAPPGTPVHAPLRGSVHAMADNAQPQDYGPVVILRHETDDSTPFYTLYGHLSRETLGRLTVGQTIERGALIGTLGAIEENGNWPPHLHLQLIVDLLGMGTDFPGVGTAAQRDVWRSLSPDPSLLAGLPPSVHEPDKAETLAARQRLVGHNLSIAYADPLKIVRGWKQYLYDDVGRRYLDAYNNVPHVGHAHPRVVQAAAEQMAVLNTNTRYLSDRLTEYAERLVSTLPAPLRVCYIVNSASEANELALRLTRARTGRRDMIVLEAAYHGNTTSLIDLSPYKHLGPGGTGTPSWVHIAPLPDDYRGLYRRNDPECGRKYARHVAELAGQHIAGFLAETCPSVGGQIMLPPNFLSAAYQAVRNAGGLCIADEVQTGLGRMGTHFWAFEAHGVVPDIVVMGKPLGNGHPLAAVVTTREIADAFDNGMEYFSTFGGNTVSCAVGLAVLDVLRDERLQEHALRVGDHMLRSLRPFVDRYPLVGDVRGSGLFLGVELVRDRETLEPAAAEATTIVNRMREMGILLGTDGPYHNVIKIRPPMPFDQSDADRLVETLDQILSARG